MITLSDLSDWCLYTDDIVTVICGDATDHLPYMATESVDLILTDPPYGVSWQSNVRKDAFAKLHNDGSEDRGVIAAVLTDCVRLVGQNRHLYVFGPDDVLAGQKVSKVVELVWDKGTLGSGDMTSTWGPQHERINFTTSKYRHAGEAGKETVPARLRKGSVLRYTRPTGRKVRHPSEKPVPLLRELIESSTRQGDLVLDPFGGIGSTAVAAITTGRRAVVIEKDPTYAAIAVERCRAALDYIEKGRWL